MRRLVRSPSAVLAAVLAVAFLAVTARKLVRNGAGPAAEGTPAEAGRSVREFWEAYRGAGEARAAGRLEDAVRLYREALSLRPGHEDSLYYQGNCAFDLGRYSEAVESYERLVAVNPQGSSRGYMQLGLLHASLEPGAPFDLDKAERYFEAALEVDPDSGAVLALGEVALLGGRWAQARERLRDAHQGDAMGMAAPYLLGYLSWREGKRDEAWDYFRLAVQRGELKKPPVKWTEEGDVKADPGLRWQALARQTVFGKHWLRLRDYLAKGGGSRQDMEREYRRLPDALRRKCTLRAAGGGREGT